MILIRGNFPAHQGQARKYPDLVELFNYYLLLAIQIDGSDVRIRLKDIKRDFRVLGQLVERDGAQVVFSLILSVTGTNVERKKKTHLVKRWLRGKCH